MEPRPSGVSITHHVVPPPQWHEVSLAEKPQSLRRPPCPVSALGAHGTGLRDCGAEGLQPFLTPHGEGDETAPRGGRRPCQACHEGHGSRRSPLHGALGRRACAVRGLHQRRPVRTRTSRMTTKTPMTPIPLCPKPYPYPPKRPLKPPRRKMIRMIRRMVPSDMMFLPPSGLCNPIPVSDAVPARAAGPANCLRS